jgi:hypothetical protein
MRTLVKIKHGSHLYGTDTPESDLDYKAVHLPSAAKILLQTAGKTVDKGVKVSDSLKNTKEDVDDQSYPLHKFLDMLIAGDTVATEILFAPKSAIVEQSEEWPIVKKLGISLLNRECKGFVGYCRRQAAKYGIKGSRMAAVRDLLALLEPFSMGNPQDKLGTLEEPLKAFAERHEFSSVEPIVGGNGQSITHFECVDRKVPFTASIKTAYDIYKKVFDNYGDRATKAMVNEGIDWKAVSHAVRVANQAIELLNTGKVTFPRPERKHLLKIKQGKLDYSNVSKELESLVATVEGVSLTSKLPEESNMDARDGCIMYYYALEITKIYAIPAKS